MNKRKFTFRPRIAVLSPATKLTAAGLVACAISLWTQWLSGDPAYPKFPPGPVFFIVVAAIVVYGARAWWTPLVGALISLFTTAGWFTRMPAEMQRLTHPGSIGTFATGIFLGTLLQVVSLATADIAGIFAAVQNYRRGKRTADGAKVALRVFGGLFVLMGVLVLVGGARVNPYHNLMHLMWGVLAVSASFAGTRMAKYFCLGSGAFFLSLGLLGIAFGNPADHMAWYVGPLHLQTGDHIFHMILGAVVLSLGMVPVRSATSLQSAA